jgi:hypothetical protein
MEQNCQHTRGKILSYSLIKDARWLEQCKDCGRLAVVTHDNRIVPLELPAPVPLEQ